MALFYYGIDHSEKFNPEIIKVLTEELMEQDFEK
jgi:hypothetical protein